MLVYENSSQKNHTIKGNVVNANLLLFVLLPCYIFFVYNIPLIAS